MNLYVARDEQVLGPYSEAQLREYLRQGVFAPIDLGVREGEEDWEPLGGLLTQLQPRIPVRIVAPDPIQAPPPPRSSGAAKWIWLLVIAACAFGVWQFFLRPGEIQGQVFVVTRGGENFRLGLVPVSLYRVEDVQPYLTQAAAKANAELDRIKPLLEAQESSYPHSDEYYKMDGERDDIIAGKTTYDGLPQPVASTQTDSDGRFSLAVPKFGEFVITAKATRLAGDTTERYYWIIHESLQGGSKTVMLSNNNMFPKE